MNESFAEDLPTEIESLVSRHFDGELDHEEHQCLQKWINARPENAKAYVGLALLHDRLLEANNQATEQRVDRVEKSLKPFSARKKNQKHLSWAIGALSSIAALLLISLFVIPMLQGTPALAAETQLEQLIEVARKSLDRTYLITSIEFRGNKRNGSKWNRKAVQEQRNRRHGRQQAPVDGALLHVRGENSYVLIRRFENGEEFVTGSDGQTSWSVPPKGRVQVSDNVERFRGEMPGNQHAIPFITLQDDLKQIRGAYNIQWRDSELASEKSRSGQHCLVAEKKSAEHRGPKYIEIWFDMETGTIFEMLLDKLPQAKGGPKTVLLELLDQSEMPDDFFQHTTHHDSNRRVNYQNE
ncbi:MAG: hypothetical protein ACPIA2_09540 [Mariniblastus sp.]